MKVTIIIPTCCTNRLRYLIQTVETIQLGTYEDTRIVIVIDGNEELHKLASKSLSNVIIKLNQKRRDWVYSINRILKEVESDYYIYASDDLVFPPGCVAHAVETIQRCFPDGFGVVSIGKKHRTAFGIFGKKWADHFPDRQVFCPDFIHYAGDSELYRTVVQLGKFAYLPDRDKSLLHFRMRDDTWRFARAERNRDHGIFHKREELGYRWGVDFNLVTEGKND